MKTLQTIFNKIAEDKTELKTHKVEFALVGDIQKAIKALTKQEKEINKAEKNINGALNSLTDAKKKAEGVYKDYKAAISGQLSINPYTVLKEARKMAKELGVDVYDIKGFNELESDAEFNEELKKKTEDKRDKLQKLI